MTPALCLRQFCCVLLTLYLVVTGCRSVSPPVEFYSLQPLARPDPRQAGQKSLGQISVGVGPLELPKILDRPQIVTRSGSHRLSIAEFNRWGGGLQDDFLRVLTENLSILLESDHVLAYPWVDYIDPTFRLYLTVYRFDGAPGGQVVLNVTWAITGPRSREVLRMRNSVFKHPVPGADFEELVSLQSLLVADLSREIAREIRELQSSLPSLNE